MKQLPLATKQKIIGGVIANPELNKTVSAGDRQCSIIQIDPRRPICSNFFEMQRRMIWVTLQQKICFIRLLLNELGQCVICRPECAARVMFQRGRVRLASWSANARDVKASSFPASAFFLIFLSKRSASNFSNQRRNASNSCSDKEATIFSAFSIVLIASFITDVVDRVTPELQNG
jgi:hypothetical protein